MRGAGTPGIASAVMARLAQHPRLAAAVIFATLLLSASLAPAADTDEGQPVGEQVRRDSVLREAPMAKMMAAHGAPVRAMRAESAPMMMAEEADVVADSRNGGSRAGGSSSSKDDLDGVQPMLVRTGRVSVQTRAGGAERVGDGVAALALSLGGVVMARNTRGAPGRGRTTDLTLSVPSEKFDTLVAGVRSVLDAAAGDELESEQTQVEDVTRRYVDVAARVRSLEATQTQLLALMERASTVKEVLEVQRELRSLNADLESQAAQAKHLRRSSAASTLHVSVRESPAPPPPLPAPPGPVGRLLALLTRLSQRVVRAWSRFALFVAYTLTDVVLVGVPAGLLVIATISLLLRALAPLAPRLGLARVLARLSPSDDGGKATASTGSGEA